VEPRQWARQRLVQAGQIDGSTHGVWRITDAGRARLLDQSQRRARRPRPIPPAPTPGTTPVESQAPGALIESAHRELRNALAAELLQIIARCSPEFFEQLVIDLLVKMGYGGTRKDAGERIGRSGDGGIDGIIKKDRLGLGVIYLQAKRWDGDTSVGRPDVQKFAGALQGHRAQRGVFITTATFTKDARDYVEKIESRIVLIDGAELARLMMDFGVGVTRIASYEIKRVDSDYFIEE
jgi:restriction system protein